MKWLDNFCLNNKAVSAIIFLYKEDIEKLTAQRQEGEVRYQSAKQDLADRIKEVKVLETSLADSKQQCALQEKTLAEKQQKVQQMAAELARAQRELRQAQTKIETINLRYKLIERLLVNDDNKREGLEAFKQVFHKQYLAFDNNELCLRDSAKLVLRLQDMIRELEIISAYPDFHKKRSVAVAGGFSTGKSEFISSLFAETQMKLPIGMQPTTAIPTYVMNGAQDEVLGCSSRWHVVNLLEIDPNLQAKLSHDFINSFGFNLKNIMPCILMSTRMNFKNLCFIDTPGYNAADKQNAFTDEDEDTSAGFVKQSEALLWLIGADANGTITQSDFDFLQKTTEQSRPIYIVLNKADIKPPDDIEDMLDVIAESLEDYDIHVQGISAYSSVQRRELAHQGIPLFDFLNSIDQTSDKRRKILKRLQSAHQAYDDAMVSEKQSKDAQAKRLKSIQLDLYENNLADLYDDKSPINSLREIEQSLTIKPTELEERRERLRAIIAALRDAVNKVFKAMPEHSYELPTDQKKDEKGAQSSQAQQANVLQMLDQSAEQYVSILMPLHKLVSELLASDGQVQADMGDELRDIKVRIRHCVKDLRRLQQKKNILEQRLEDLSESELEELTEEVQDEINTLIEKVNSGNALREDWQQTYEQLSSLEDDKKNDALKELITEVACSSTGFDYYLDDLIETLNYALDEDDEDQEDDTVEPTPQGDDFSEFLPFSVDMETSGVIASVISRLIK